MLNTLYIFYNGQINSDSYCRYCIECFDEIDSCLLPDRDYFIDEYIISYE